MGYSFDYLVGKFTCPICGFVSRPDSSTNLQTKLSKNPGMNSYGIGDKLDLDLENIGESGYLLVKVPKNPNIFTLIESWECPNCDNAFNWVVVKIDNGTITSIEDIELSEDTIATCNYISEDCGYLGWQIHEGGIRQVDH